MKTCFITILISFIYSFNLSAQQQENIHWNRGRGYRPFFFATNEGININNQTSEEITDSYVFDSPTQGFNLSFRAANYHGNPSKRYPYIDGNGIIHKKGNPDWGFFILFSDGDTLKFTIKRTETPNSITSSPETLIAIEYPGNMGYMNHEITSGETDCHSGVNLWQIKATAESVSLYGGNRKQVELASIREIGKQYQGFGFYAGTASDITVSDISLSISKYESGFKPSQWEDKDYLRNYLSTSRDPMEGIWVIFDRNLEESLLKPGGDYVLAIVREDERYLMIYLEGAAVNSQKWAPGMIKGILNPTYFNGIYDTEWIDAEGQSLNNGVKSQYGEGETLTIQFPYHSSSLRLRKASGFKEF